MNNKKSIKKSINQYARFVKIQHSIFALPFLIGGIFLAPSWHSLTAWQWLAILTAMVSARNAAMGFNRLVDAKMDSLNPRTQNREIPRGVISHKAALIFITANSLLFIGSAFFINTIAWYLSPIVLALLFSYSLSKKFTWLCHFLLGLVIGLAPTAGWVAVTASIAWQPLLLSGALMFYIAGFDLLYATQDMDFDRQQGLNSIPARFNVATSLWIARVSHFVSLLFFIAVGLEFGLSLAYWLGIIIIAFLMIFENSLVKKDDLTLVPVAFFHVNSVISILVGVSLLSGVFLQWK